MSRLSDFVGDRSLGQIYDEGWVPAVLEPFKQDFENYISPGLEVLDVGCGTGFVTHYVSGIVGSDGRVVGIDPTDFLLERALLKPSENPIEWMNCTVEEMPFQANSFDVVVCNQALQYMEDPLKSLKAMKHVVKPNGIVVVSVWSPVELQVPVRDFEELIAKFISPEVATIHAFGFGGVDRLSSLAVKSDLEINSVKTISHPTVYNSVADCVELMLGGAGRMLPDGTMGMGLFDLEDPKYFEGVEDLIRTLEIEWSSYLAGDHLSVPYFSDLIVLKKQ
jgi:ubiquinone/menaquinone biosynthesis C-methylase UbiE